MYYFREKSNFPFSNQEIITLTVHLSQKWVKPLLTVLVEISINSAGSVVANNVIGPGIQSHWRHCIFWRLSKMEISTNTVSRDDYEPITVPITLVQQDLSHCKPQLRLPQWFSRLPPLGAIFFKCAPLTWNPGSAPGFCCTKIIGTVSLSNCPIYYG
jgi:hypothetical protein